MIYLDSSVALAEIRSEQRCPTPAFWQQAMVSSRLLQFEVWNRLHAYRSTAYRRAKARQVLGRVRLVDMSVDVLVRALRPFPIGIRTLDGLHLATIEYLRGRGADIQFASYDVRLLEAAAGIGIAIVEP